MVDRQNLIKILKNFDGYLEDLLKKHERGEKIHWDKDMCDRMQTSIQAEIISEYKQVQNAKTVLTSISAFIRQQEISTTMSRNEFYGSLQHFYNQLLQLKSNGELRKLLLRISKDILFFRAVMEKKFPAENAFFFFVNENNQNITALVKDSRFIELLKRLKNSNSKFKEKYSKLRNAIITLQFRESGNNENYLGSFNEFDEKQRKRIRKLASNLSTNELNELVNKTIQELYQEIHSMILKMFVRKEKRRLAKLKEIETTVESSDIDRLVSELTKWDSNYTWEDVKNKIPVLEELKRKIA